jgi:GDP-4-dehydro-6-deoxy-D-mannose reductase
MRLLVTGINGFVGGHLAERLLASGEGEVWGLARQPALALPQLHGRVQFVCADLYKLDQVVSALQSVRPDVIFHLAGQSNVPRSFADPADTLLTNVLAQLHLFQAVLRLHQSPVLLIAGSNEIYGKVQPAELPLNEDTPLRPVNPYAVSKAAQDLLTYQYHVSHELRTLQMRPFNHIGPRQSEHFVASAFAAQIARIEAGLQEPLLRVGNLAAERDFTDVRDVARGYELAVKHAQVGRAYNLGSGHAVSIRWLLDTLLTFSECDIAVEPDPSRMRPADVPRVVCDCRRFHEQTGWTPQIPLEQTLYDILEYWRARIHAEKAHS